MTTFRLGYSHDFDINLPRVVMAREIFGPDYLPYRQETQMQKEMEGEELIPPLFLVFYCSIIPVSRTSKDQVSEAQA